MHVIPTQTVNVSPKGLILETWVRSLGWEGHLEQVMATHSSILAWRILWTEEPGGLSSWGHQESDTVEQLTFKINSLIQQLLNCV